VPNAPPVEYLPLNVFQSVDVKYPLTEVVAAAIDIAGVAPPLETTGAVPVTDVTVPTLAVPPKLTDDPFIVILEFTRPEFGNPVQLVRVPEAGVPSAGVVSVGLVNVLFVRVSTPSIVTALSAG
jgi:hypothetical protein